MAEQEYLDELAKAFLEALNLTAREMEMFVTLRLKYSGNCEGRLRWLLPVPRVASVPQGALQVKPSAGSSRNRGRKKKCATAKKA